MATQPIKITEIFYSLQGEGPRLGRPSIFIRTAYCSLSCIFCDIPEAWRIEEHRAPNKFNRFAKESDFIHLEPKELLAKIDELNTKCDIILTGGEPLMQQKAFVSFLELFHKKYPTREVTVETNGIHSPLREFAEHIALYVVSPKFKSSGNNGARENKKSFEWFSGKHEYTDLNGHLVPPCDRSIWKPVVCDDKDLVEFQYLIDKYNINETDIYCMPEGVDNETLQKNMLWLSEVCKQKNWNMTTRLQIAIWNNKRAT